MVFGPNRKRKSVFPSFHYVVGLKIQNPFLFLSLVISDSRNPKNQFLSNPNPVKPQNQNPVTPLLYLFLRVGAGGYRPAVLSSSVIARRNSPFSQFALLLSMMLLLFCFLSPVLVSSLRLVAAVVLCRRGLLLLVGDQQASRSSTA